MTDSDTDDAVIARIQTISENARATWFGLFAVLAFVGVVLMGHSDATFYAEGAVTELPLLAVDVLPIAFFIAALLIVMAVYAYLHLYLVTLWQALAAAPARVQNVALADRVFVAIGAVVARPLAL